MRELGEDGKGGAARHFPVKILPSIASGMTASTKPLFVPVGSSSARLFGMDVRTRACRLAGNAGFDCADGPSPGHPTLVASLDHAWDPAWLKLLGSRSSTVLTLGGEPVLAHVPAGHSAELSTDGLTLMAAETAEISYSELRKRDRPFVMRIDPGDPLAAERAAYDAAYKGVTDVLTLYLWRRPAFHLTRWAAQAGMTPNLVTAIGALLCVLAFYLFWIGDYWLGVASGFGFMVLDTVDGKLARCTGASSKWGNLFDHGIDLVHPPFWWWAWLHGLDAYGRPLEPVYATSLLGTIVVGYVVQRLVEGVFMRRFGGMHIHVWRPIDSRFRLITARRNPNMVILVGALLFGRPDIGIELVALWTVVSLIFHAVRYAQASAQAERGKPVTSWLAG